MAPLARSTTPKKATKAQGIQRLRSVTHGVRLHQPGPRKTVSCVAAVAARAVRQDHRQVLGLAARERARGALTWTR